MKAPIGFKVNGKVIAHKVMRATGFSDRLLGLMFKKEMKEMDGLLIDPCNSIHTFFMKFPIDVVFLSDSFKVVKIIRKMDPWRISGLYFSAKMVLEMEAGTLPSEIAIGDQIEVVCTN